MTVAETMEVTRKLMSIGILDTTEWISKNPDRCTELLSKSSYLITEDTTGGFEFLRIVLSVVAANIFVLNPTDFVGGVAGGIELVLKSLRYIPDNSPIVYVLVDDDISNDNDMYINTYSTIDWYCALKNNLHLLYGYKCFESIPISVTKFCDWIKSYANVDSNTMNKLQTFNKYLNGGCNFRSIPREWFEVNGCEHSIEYILGLLLNQVHTDKAHRLTKKHIGSCWEELCVDVKCNQPCILQELKDENKLVYLFNNSYYRTLGGVIK